MSDAVRPGGRHDGGGPAGAARSVDAAQARAAFAAAAFGLSAGPAAPVTVGPVALHPHQRAAAARIRGAMATHGGALLADAVGLGKTWVALAVVQNARAPLVIAPAALLGMWRAAAARAGVTARVASVESLSAGAPMAGPRPDLVVVDEAHHVRTRGTRRRARLAAVSRGVPLLLLSATPVHNGTADATALLALFLGEPQADHLDAATLAHLVVRRRRRELAAYHAADVCRATDGPPPSAGARAPAVTRARWHRPPGPAGVLRALCAVPAPVRPAGAGGAPALATVTLVRLWASSDAAVRAGLRRRLARAAALAHALDGGTLPGARELAEWAAEPGAVQLPLLLPGGAPAPGAAELACVRRQLADHETGLRRALAALDAAPPADPDRIACLRGWRARHPGERLVAFAQSADTARAVYRALAPEGRVGLLTAAGSRIASGPIAREALLARFAPRAHAVPDPPAAERVDTLVATDCVSEGLDLRDATVVVHLDVPWTPARLAQRVGRAARPGAPAARVAVYGLAPNAAAGAWLRLAHRLRAKASAARLVLGGAANGPTSGPPRAGGSADRALARRFANLRRLERWLLADPAVARTDPERAPPGGLGGPAACAVRCGLTGFLAVWHPGGRGPPVVVAALGGRRPSDAPARVGRVLRRLELAGAACAWSDALAASAARAGRAVCAWAARRGARAAVGDRAGPALLTRQAGSPRAVRSPRDAPSGAPPSDLPAHRRGRWAADWRAASPGGGGAGAGTDGADVGLHGGAPRLTALVLLVP